MCDLDIDLSELFPILDEATGERDFIVERKWMYLRCVLWLVSFWVFWPTSTPISTPPPLTHTSRL